MLAFLIAVLALLLALLGSMALVGPPRRTDDTPVPLLPHPLPLGWGHVNLTGDDV